MNYRYAIGVDPGVTTGIAVWDRREKALTRMESMTWWEAFDWIAGLDPTEYWITVEDSSKNNFTYKRHGGDISRKISRNAGMNQGMSRLMIEGLKRRGFTVREVVPGGRKKLNSDMFRLYTKWEDCTSQHARDAAMMVFGL